MAAAASRRAALAMRPLAPPMLPARPPGASRSVRPGPMISRHEGHRAALVGTALAKRCGSAGRTCAGRVPEVRRPRPRWRGTGASCLTCRASHAVCQAGGVLVALGDLLQCPRHVRPLVGGRASALQTRVHRTLPQLFGGPAHRWGDHLSGGHGLAWWRGGASARRPGPHMSTSALRRPAMRCDGAGGRLRTSPPFAIARRAVSIRSKLPDSLSSARVSSMSSWRTTLTSAGESIASHTLPRPTSTTVIMTSRPIGRLSSAWRLRTSTPGASRCPRARTVGWASR